MVVSTSEHQFQMRILFVLSVLAALVALTFSQSAGLFNPPAIIAARAQLPAEPQSGVAPGPGFESGADRPRGPARGFVPRQPGIVGSAPRPQGIDDGMGGPIEMADATGAVPSSIAQDLLAPSAGVTADPASGGASGPDAAGPGFTGPGATGPGAVGPGGGGNGGGDPGTGNPGGGGPGTDPVVPTSPVPEPATWLILIAGVAIIGAALRRPRPARSGRGKLASV